MFYDNFPCCTRVTSFTIRLAAPALPCGSTHTNVTHANVSLHRYLAALSYYIKQLNLETTWQKQFQMVLPGGKNWFDLLNRVHLQRLVRYFLDLKASWHYLPCPVLYYGAVCCHCHLRGTLSSPIKGRPIVRRVYLPSVSCFHSVFFSSIGDFSSNPGSSWTYIVLPGALLVANTHRHSKLMFPPVTRLSSHPHKQLIELAGYCPYFNDDIITISVFCSVCVFPTPLHADLRRKQRNSWDKRKDLYSEKKKHFFCETNIEKRAERKKRRLVGRGRDGFLRMHQ